MKSITRKKINKKLYYTSVKGIKVEYGFPGKGMTKSLYSIMYIPIRVDLSKIDKIDYDRFSRKMQFSINRIIYNKMGDTKSNFGCIEFAKWQMGNTKRTNLMTLNIIIKNNYLLVNESENLFVSIIEEFFKSLHSNIIEGMTIIDKTYSTIDK